MRKMHGFKPEMTEAEADYIEEMWGNILIADEVSVETAYRCSVDSLHHDHAVGLMRKVLVDVATGQVVEQS
jgi:hypothetical protein